MIGRQPVDMDCVTDSRWLSIVDGRFGAP